MLQHVLSVSRANRRDDHSTVTMREAARYLLRLRKAAKSCFGQPSISEPAWNLMLALYSTEEAGKKLHIGSIAKRADVPRSTALRWLIKLESSGFVDLLPDPSDKRAVRVRMTSEGAAAMQRSFTAARFIT